MNKLGLTLAMLAITTPAIAQSGAPWRPSLPPPEYEGRATGQVVITKWNDYTLIRSLCKNEPNTNVACSYRTYETNTGKPISCLIMLGPLVHNDERALKHELAHCAGWPADHPGARP